MVGRPAQRRVRRDVAHVVQALPVSQRMVELRLARARASTSAICTRLCALSSPSAAVSIGR